MFLEGMLSPLKSPSASQADLAEVRRYLKELAHSGMHLFGDLVC